MRHRLQYDMIPKSRRYKNPEDRELIYNSLMIYMKRFRHCHWMDQLAAVKLVAHKIKEKGLEEEFENDGF